MIDAREIRPGVYTDEKYTWRRNNEGQTTHPRTMERVHYGCGQIKVEPCYCIGHEGVIEDSRGEIFCPPCRQLHRKDIQHAVRPIGLGFGKLWRAPSCDTACGYWGFGRGDFRARRTSHSR